MGYRWSDKDRSIADGFLRIAREQAVKAEIAARDETGDAGARVHACRRHVKKLRALLRLVRPDFPDYAMENRRLRDAGRKLSSVRDAAVTAQLLAELLGRSDGDTDTGTDDTAARQALAMFAEEMRSLIARLDFWPVSAISGDTLARGLLKTYRAARREARKARTDHNGELMHEWRKDAKYHYFHLRLLEGFAPEALPPRVDTANQLAELLGQHHDMVVLRDHLKTNGHALDGIDGEAASRAAKHRRLSFEPDIARLGAELFADKPKALLARLDALRAS